MKLKLENEWKREETRPGPPVEEADMIYGIKVDPSKSAEDALPKDESAKAPDTRSMRSDSMMPLAEWVSCSGTIVS